MSLTDAHDSPVAQNAPVDQDSQDLLKFHDLTDTQASPADAQTSPVAHTPPVEGDMSSAQASPNRVMFSGRVYVLADFADCQPYEQEMCDLYNAQWKPCQKPGKRCGQPWWGIGKAYHSVRETIEKCKTSLVKMKGVLRRGLSRTHQGRVEMRDVSKDQNEVWNSAEKKF